jgi:hypothetical protein
VNRGALVAPGPRIADGQSPVAEGNGQRANKESRARDWSNSPLDTRVPARQHETTMNVTESQFFSICSVLRRRGLRNAILR